MAKTWGYALSGFTSGFQTGLGLGMERKKLNMLKEEQKRAEKLAKEKEENATNWLNTNEDSLMNFHTQPQNTRNMLILESINYKKEWTDYLRDVEDFLQSGDLEGLKNLNNMEEEKIKAERDMLGLGVRPENAFVGKYYSEKDMEYVKKLQMGKLPIKPIGKKMYEEEFGKLPAETKEPDLPGSITYLKKFPNPTPEQFSSLKAGAERYFNVDLSNVTQESLREPEKVVEVTEEEPILRTDIAYWEKTFDAVKSEEEYNRQYALLKQSKTSKQYEPKPYKDMLINEVTAMAKELKDLLTPDNKFKDDESKATYTKYQKIYEKKVRELMTKYPDIDISQFPKYLQVEEIKPVGFWKGLITGGGIARGDYSVIDIKGW